MFANHPLVRYVVLVQTHNKLDRSLCETTISNATKIMSTSMLLRVRQSLRSHATSIAALASFIAIALATGGDLDAHDEFKEVLERRYRLKSVSCKACHTDNKDKKVRNAFGKLLDKELKEKKLSEGYRAAKDEGDDAKKRFEKQMVKEFSIALNAIENKPVTFLALMEAGLLNGTRLDKNQVDVDTLTIKTLTDPDVEELKIASASVIEGEVKQMPTEEDEASAENSEMKQGETEPAKQPNATDSKPKTDSDDNPADQPKTPAPADEADKPK